MPIGVIFIVSAMVLYSIAIWSEKLTKNLVLWMVVTLATGFLCDLVGTTVMRLQATKIGFNLHSFWGYTALVVMAVHLAWAILALRQWRQCAIWFKHGSVYAWGLWMLAFISGILQSL